MTGAAVPFRHGILPFAAAALLCACGAADEQPAFPYFSEEGGRVRDAANLLSEEEEAQLTAKLDQAEAAWGPQMVVVTVDSLHGYSIEDFSLQYAKAWGVGHATRNDGLQLLVAPNERKVRIEVGKGLEKTFTDAYAQGVIDIMLPYFRRSDFEGGIYAGVDELIEYMSMHPTLPANDNSRTQLEEAA